MIKYPKLGSKWSKLFWAKGYYVTTVGNLAEEAIKKYIKEQYEVRFSLVLVAFRDII